MPHALVTYIFLAPGLPLGQQLPPRPPSPSWGQFTPAQQATLLDATPLVLEVIPGRTTLLVLDADATGDRVEAIDFRWRHDPNAPDRALAVADRAVTRQIDKLEVLHGGQLSREERSALRRELVDRAGWAVLLAYDPEKAPTPSAWLLSHRGPMNNAIRCAVRASRRRQLRAEGEPATPPARASRAKPMDLDPLVLACRAGMVAHLNADPLALGYLHRGLAPSALASSPAAQRATRRRLAALRAQAKTWARRSGFTVADACRAFPGRCPRYVEPTGAATPGALRALELAHRDAAWAQRNAA
jgi:hypothetical protein